MLRRDCCRREWTSVKCGAVHSRPAVGPHEGTDKGILQIALIASWFDYINRVADALGVGREDPATACTLPIPEPAVWRSDSHDGTAAR